MIQTSKKLSPKKETNSDNMAKRIDGPVQKMSEETQLQPGNETQYLESVTAVEGGRSRTKDTRHRGFRVTAPRFLVTASRFRVTASRFRVTASRFSVSASRFSVSASRFRVTAPR